MADALTHAPPPTVQIPNNESPGCVKLCTQWFHTHYNEIDQNLLKEEAINWHLGKRLLFMQASVMASKFLFCV